MKTGLVLEGGGMRGIYAAGVLDAMDEAGLRAAFDGVIGVSAGAVHGCSFVSGQRGRSIRYFTRYCRDRGFMSVYSLLTTGNAVGEKLCYHDIPEKLDPFDNEAFMASPTAFYVGVTNLETGEGEYPRVTDLFAQMDWLRASASMPYVSRIVMLEGKPYLDGGIADSVPLAAFERMGYARNVVVLTKEEGFERRSDNIPLLNFRYRKYPRFLETLARRVELCEAEERYIQRAAAEGRAFVIRPSRKPEIGRLERDPERLQNLYELGRQDALAALPAMKRFLGAEGGA